MGKQKIIPCSTSIKSISGRSSRGLFYIGPHKTAALLKKKNFASYNLKPSKKFLKSIF